MAPVHTAVGIFCSQESGIGEEIVKSPASGGGSRRRLSLKVAIPAGIFDVKNPNLMVARACYQGTVIRVWHELDREDIRPVTRMEGGIQGEGRR
jgi:hypothetical protein